MASAWANVRSQSITVGMAQGRASFAREQSWRSSSSCQISEARDEAFEGFNGHILACTSIEGGPDDGFRTKEEISKLHFIFPTALTISETLYGNILKEIPSPRDPLIKQSLKLRPRITRKTREFGFDLQHALLLGPYRRSCERVGFADGQRYSLLELHQVGR